MNIYIWYIITNFLFTRMELLVLTPMEDFLVFVSMVGQVKIALKTLMIVLLRLASTKQLVWTKWALFSANVRQEK